MPGINLPDPGDVSSSWTGRQIGALASARGVGRVWRWRSCRRSSPSPLPPVVAVEEGVVVAYSWRLQSHIKTTLLETLLERDSPEALKSCLMPFRRLVLMRPIGPVIKEKMSSLLLWTLALMSITPILKMHLTGRGLLIVQLETRRGDSFVTGYLCQAGECSSASPECWPSVRDCSASKGDVSWDACLRYHRSQR